ncbi:sigma-70 family RNA polymerase sigma factor [Nordella sp. HKS 07]|uniref:sigma-70 family RNA polymerase sigma factor n=1 Tax=Nordella sp. HKS 07 TaxID=2712222 RepID=UPI0013E1AE22|nr:sigma-70 family RNA polymerase sigma factor [Nordella sp. HKS 07]QIG50328.1 sigma-70 family RNA polymerase sigma factor [Nordella sp. HKS 07]
MSADEEQWAVLMRAAMAGDEAAYRKFLKAVTPAIRAAARRNLARYGLSAGDAEDVVQDTLLAIHLKRQTWDSERPIGPWISAIARNKFIDQMRRRGHRTQVPIETVAESLAAEEQPALDGYDVGRMLENLNEKQRDVVRSLAVEGASVRQTAERLKMTEGAIRVTLHRAVKALAAIYRERGT